MSPDFHDVHIGLTPNWLRLPSMTAARPAWQGSGPLTVADPLKRALGDRETRTYPPTSPAAATAMRAVGWLRAHRLLRFLIVGGVNTVVGYGVFLAALAVLPTPTLALVLATGFGILFNFLSTGRLVFDSSDPRRLPGFLAVHAVIFAYNAAAIGLAARAGVGPRVAAVLALPGAVAMSFCLQRWVVFRRACA